MESRDIYMKGPPCCINTVAKEWIARNNLNLLSSRDKALKLFFIYLRRIGVKALIFYPPSSSLTRVHKFFQG